MDMRVNITYLDGTTENVSNIPTEEIAVGIYAEAVTSDRVRNAELIDNAGFVVQRHRAESHGLSHDLTQARGMDRL
jgi:hypothetical protein